MLRGDIADQFLDEHSLSHARSAEKSDLTTLCIRRQKVNDLDSGLQNLHNRALILKCRRLPVDDPFLSIIDRLAVVNSLAEHVKQSAKRPLSHRHLDACSGSSNLHILVKSLAGGEHQTAHLIVPKMLGDLHDALFAVVVHFQRILDKREVSVFKYYVNDRSHDLYDSSFIHDHNRSHFL